MPNSEPRIVFCTTCKGRLQHVQQTLPRNLVSNARYPNCAFVLLDYNSPDRLLDYLALAQTSAIQSGKLIVYSYPAPGPFKMAHAKNMAHRLGIIEGADILVNLDADNFTGQNFASYIAEKFTAAENNDVFLWANRKQPSEERYPKGCNGRIVVSRHAFLNAGGYDEKYAAWGPDDKDFNFRLRRLGYIGGEIERKYLDVVLHTDRMRFREYPEAQVDGGEDLEVIENETTTIANFGNFGRGVVFRNFGRDPIELGPLPTRIFGIGMHKTGTTSLHTALQILGYDSAHWKSAHWAKSIWREMTDPGDPMVSQFGMEGDRVRDFRHRSPTLERSYALCDLPIPILFRELDAAYPGSKFILTTRNEDRWLTSVKNHWDPSRNKFRAGWDSDPFTHKVHKLLYGQKGFNAELFLARFRQHNADVLDHFRGRGRLDDLLVMDMDANAGWPQLCGFLRRQIPEIPYPQQFQTPFGKKGEGI
jgi:hypothetical protein